MIHRYPSSDARPAGSLSLDQRGIHFPHDGRGATWNGQLVSANAELAAGSAPAPNVCWVVGAKGTIYRTTDGIAWKKVHAPSPADFTAISATDASSATLTAAGGKKFSTANNGKSWQPVQ